MTDFLWHKVSDEEKEQIKKQAKNIMDSFSDKLSKVGKIKESLIERDECERQENDKGSLELDRDIMFENAPNKKDKEFIVGEKGGWG